MADRTGVIVNLLIKCLLMNRNSLTHSPLLKENIWSRYHDLLSRMNLLLRRHLLRGSHLHSWCCLEIISVSRCLLLLLMWYLYLLLYLLYLLSQLRQWLLIYRYYGPSPRFPREYVRSQRQPHIWQGSIGSSLGEIENKGPLGILLLLIQKRHQILIEEQALLNSGQRALDLRRRHWVQA